MLVAMPLKSERAEPRQRGDSMCTRYGKAPATNQPILSRKAGAGMRSSTAPVNKLVVCTRLQRMEAGCEKIENANETYLASLQSSCVGSVRFATRWDVQRLHRRRCGGGGEGVQRPVDVAVKRIYAILRMQR